MSSEYENQKKGTMAHSDSKDCSVIAISIACRIPYDVAHDVCRKNGRKNNRGFWPEKTFSDLKDLGYVFEEVKNIKQKNGSKYTPKTIGNKLKKGYYLCYVKSHVFAVKNGNVCDWSKGHRHRIYKIYKVTKKHS